MNLCDERSVKRIMSMFSTGTKKSFGQNFLINPDVPYNIARESYEYHRARNGAKKSAVIEIGPGIGSLTQELCEMYDKVIAVEIDKTLIPVLEYTLAEHKNVTVINDDFLKLDLEKLIKEELDGYEISVCANLPYYITTPIIMALLENARRENGTSYFTSITVMVQREVALRLCATPKQSDYGAITASINYYGNIEKLFDVTPDNFLPAPKVTSSVVRIELYDTKKYEVRSEKMLHRVISGAFMQRRKTLLNSLSSAFLEIPKDTLGDIIERCGFEPTVRGERLSVEDFCRLSDEIFLLKN